MRYVLACGTLSLGFGSVVEVPGVVVYRLEGCTTGLDGPCSGIPQSAGGDQKHQVRNAHPSLDSDMAGVYGLADVASLRDLE